MQPLDWTTQGRGGLQSWKTLGYIPTDDYDPWGGALRTRSISRTVEYAYNDFCLSLLSSLSPTPQETASLYLSRSKNWQNLFLPTQTSPTILSNYTGFLQPRFANGSFDFQDPALCSPLLNFTDCSLNAEGHETYEGSVWLYSFYVPHAMNTLITLLGGREKFLVRLKYFHTSGLLYVGNEQAFLTVYQFHYAGRPGLSAEFARRYIGTGKAFNETEGGIPGNDDSGAMGSFTVLSMLGLWPVSGQDVYLITPPFFREVRVRNGDTGRWATVRCQGEGGYVKSARLDGVVLERNWLTHEFWMEGGTLELVLGREESGWGTREGDLPPSY